MVPAGTIRIRVRHPTDKKKARQEALALALRMGFGQQAVEELGLAVTELASNLLGHAPGGEIRLAPLKDGPKTGLQVESRDTGPGMTNLEQAVGDGFSTGHSLGYGLGTVNRVMDEMRVQSPAGPEGGTRIICCRWLKAEPSSQAVCPVSFGVATRPLPGSKINGDAFFVKNWGSGALAAVIDGLGHGQYAHRPANKARNYLGNHYDQPLDNLFLGVSRECVATRGAVMAVARFRLNPLGLSFASVGNIEARLFGSPQDTRFPVRRGILGLKAPRPLVSERPWGRGYGLVMHSDGLSSHWGWQDFPGLWEMPPQTAAQRLLHALAKEHDDATVVVVKGVEP